MSGAEPQGCPQCGDADAHAVWCPILGVERTAAKQAAAQRDVTIAVAIMREGADVIAHVERAGQLVCGSCQCSAEFCPDAAAQLRVAVCFGDAIAVGVRRAAVGARMYTAARRYLDGAT